MIQIGQKVYSGLYGGRHGVVYAIHGAQRPDSVGSMHGGVIRFGGNAYFDIVFTNGTESHQLPETILYGVQWKIFDEVVSAEEIRAMRGYAASETTRKEAETKRKSDEFSAAVAALRAAPRYKGLQQTSQENAVYESKLAAINIRRELKTAFPGVKFSVTSSYDSARIVWTDGPTTGEVENITGKYQGGFFDGMEDMYHFTDSPWTSVFGSAKYVSTSRKHSADAMTKAVEHIHKTCGWPLAEVKVSDFDGSAFPGAVDYHHNKAIYDYLEQRGNFALAA